MSNSEGATSIALLGSSNLQFFASALSAELRRFNWQPSIWESGFNQYRQDIENPVSPLYSAKRGIVIMHLDGEDLFADRLRSPFDDLREARISQAGTIVREVEHCVEVLKTRLPEAVVVLNTI